MGKNESQSDGTKPGMQVENGRIKGKREILSPPDLESLPMKSVRLECTSQSGLFFRFQRESSGHGQGGEAAADALKEQFASRKGRLGPQSSSPSILAQNNKHSAKVSIRRDKTV